MFSMCIWESFDFDQVFSLETLLKNVEAEHLENGMMTSNPVAYHEAWKKLCQAEWVRWPPLHEPA